MVVVGVAGSAHSRVGSQTLRQSFPSGLLQSGVGPFRRLNSEKWLGLEPSQIFNYLSPKRTKAHEPGLNRFAQSIWSWSDGTNGGLGNASSADLVQAASFGTRQCSSHS
jgi:hypothetical protein